MNANTSSLPYAWLPESDKQTIMANPWAPDFYGIPDDVSCTHPTLQKEKLGENPIATTAQQLRAIPRESLVQALRRDESFQACLRASANTSQTKPLETWESYAEYVDPYL